ncbi:MAG TPA: iron ABC transporter permease [Trueperaceae bacterium]|jgi:iron complex transport system permease protein
MTGGAVRTARVRTTRAVGLVLAAGVVTCLLAVSLGVGSLRIPIADVVTGLIAPSGELNDLILQTVRLPRTLAGLLVGASLAVAGAIMQALTRNPLASPGILGVNAGAALAVVAAVLVLGDPPLATYALFALAGAGLAGALVYGLASAAGAGGSSPLRLALAGAVLAAFLGALTTALLLLDQNTLDQVRFWTAGSLAGRDWELLGLTAPYMLLGLALSLPLARQLTTLSLGEDVARGLGQGSAGVKLAAAASVVLLAGGAVALAGPVGFVGLVAPHLARFLVGVDYRWVLPYSALLGAALVTVGDIGARLAVRPQEIPVGVLMAVIGAPFFVYLARTRVHR